MDAEAQLKRYSALIEDALSDYLPQEKNAQALVFEAARYSLLGGGKRIRPALLLEFYKACGGRVEDALPFACGLEMIHTYSLVHDDLPCMDNDDLRRGKPSSHKAFGEAVAVLVGDVLLNRAFEVMLDDTRSAIEPRNAMHAAHEIARCSGGYGMIGGQIIDITLSGKTYDSNQLVEMVHLKTGALLEAACAGGCLLAGADEVTVKAARQYAACVGLAFQIKDDVLDVQGSEAVLGKRTGNDAQNEKYTFVSAYGLTECNEIIKQLTADALKALRAFEQRDFLEMLALWLVNRTY